MRVEPLIRTTPATHTADIRVEKTIRIGKASMAFYGDVFNVTNAGVPRSYVALSGPRFGLPQAWIEPRTLRAGVNVRF